MSFLISKDFRSADPAPETGGESGQPVTGRAELTHLLGKQNGANLRQFRRKASTCRISLGATTSRSSATVLSYLIYAGSSAERLACHPSTAAANESPWHRTEDQDGDFAASFWLDRFKMPDKDAEKG